MTVSQWQRSLSPQPVGCDIAVVGAGIAGVSAALDLERRGIDVLLLDRDRPAAGATGRNAGFLMRGAAENYLLAVRAYGRAAAAQLWRWTEENLAGLRAEGIEGIPTYQRIPSCLLALDPPEAEELRQSAQLLADDGFDVDLIDRGDDLAWRPRSADPRTEPPVIGLVNPNDAACNPVHLLAFLTARLRKPPVERQEVHALTHTPSGRVVLHTADRSIECRHVLVCTNAYAGLLFPRLAPHVRPTRGQMLALRVPDAPARLDMSYYANHGYEYFRQTTDGAIVLGGCRRGHADAETGYEDRITSPVQRDLEAFARARLADRFEIVARWSGVMGFTADALPLIGPVPTRPDGHPSVWFCGGCTGHGMSMFHRTARAAVACMLDNAHNPYPLDRVLNAASHAEPHGEGHPSIDPAR